MANVAMPRRLNVAMLQRHDVSSISASPSLKEKGTRNRGGLKIRTNKGTKSKAAATQISREETYFCIFFFSDKIADVL